MCVCVRAQEVGVPHTAMARRIRIKLISNLLSQERGDSCTRRRRRRRLFYIDAGLQQQQNKHFHSVFQSEEIKKKSTTGVERCAGSLAELVLIPEGEVIVFVTAGGFYFFPLSFLVEIQA